MKTGKPLRDMIPEVMSHVRSNLEFQQYNNRLMLVHEGQLRKEIEDSMQQELSPESWRKAIKRVPSINLLVRIIDKLSRVYTDPAQRTTDKQNEPLLRWYESQLDLTRALPNANRMYNLHKCCALEPYLYDGQPALRVIPAHRFMVYSDSLEHPLVPTVFIKCLGRELKVPYTNRDGTKTNRQEPYFVEKYALYSDDEIFVVNSYKGQYADDADKWYDEIDGASMVRMDMDGTNPLGVIPFVYVNKSEFYLMPVPDTDTLDNTILIPKLLADLNYAVQYQSHSITVATDVELPANVPWNPDVVISVKTDEGAKQQGQIHTVKPTVDIEKVLLLIETTIAFWLEARNIKTTSVVGKVTAESASSGIAKIIDEADATQDRRAQMTVFQQVEEKLWDLITRFHDYWTRTGQIEQPLKFSDSFSVGIKFANMQPMQSEQDELNIVAKELEMGLINKRMAMQRLNPFMGPSEIDQLLRETGSSDLYLTGVQFRGLVELITAVSAGQIPRSTGVGVISQAFSVLPAVADKMLGTAGLDETGKELQVGFQSERANTSNPGQGVEVQSPEGGGLNSDIAPPAN